jgi:hypothetical protein
MTPLSVDPSYRLKIIMLDVMLKQIVRLNNRIAWILWDVADLAVLVGIKYLLELLSKEALDCRAGLIDCYLYLAEELVIRLEFGL